MKLLGLLLLAATAVVCNAMIQGTPSSHVPYSVSVRTLNFQGAFRNGGGAIISQRHVLTSSSMVIGFSGYSITFGPTRNESGSTTLPAAANFNSFMPHFNDLGLIITDTNIVFTSTIQPIQLPRYVVRENEQGMIVGFGGAPNALAGMLFAAFPRVTTGTRCLSRWPAANLATQFCAEDERVRSDFCTRNVGSALTMLNRGVEEVVGISLQAHCLTTGTSQPSVYANVFAHRAWILQQTGI
ncbi:unnamed protein product [Diamesa tonsa]